MWDLKLKTLPTGKYKQLRDFIEKTRLRRQAAESALQRHIAEHGCGDAAASSTA